jgi:hypothetical protein
MESHPYTKPRGVGPVTTELTPGAGPSLLIGAILIGVEVPGFRRRAGRVCPILRLRQGKKEET